MCHEDTSSVSQTFKSNHAHTQRTQNEQNQWKSNQSLLHVPESRINIQGQNGVPLQPTWGEFQALTHCEFIPEITKQNTPVIPVRGTYRNSSPTLLDFGQPSFSIHSNNTLVAELSKTVQVRLLFTSLHQIKGLYRETHELSRK
jgi:hypothetical protein